MSANQMPLPEFRSPPVTEVAISIQFRALPKLKGSYIGLFWSMIREEYPDTDMQPTLFGTTERYGLEFWQPSQPQTFDLMEANGRFWFIARPSNYLIQVQHDRFILNWRRLRSDEVYPRYDAEIRPRFLKEWQRFEKFIGEFGLGPIEIQQCELTYVNDIPEGEAWQDVSGALDLLSLWSKPGQDRFLPAPQVISINAAYELPNAQGRLHFLGHNVWRSLDQKQVMQLRLIARGDPGSSEDEGVMRWFDLGREWIVRGFAEVTSQKAHQLWQRTR